MIDDLFTYELADLLAFTPDVYLRLFAAQNEALWPWQPFALLLGLAAIWFARREDARGVGIALAVAWAVVGGTYFIARYAELLWVAPWFGAAFLLQAAVLVICGITGRLEVARDSSVALAVVLLLGWPLLAPLSGRTWLGSELFAVAPDPTVVVTLALLGRAHILLWLIPLCWAVITTATAVATEVWVGLATPIAVVAIAGRLLWSRSRQR